MDYSDDEYGYEYGDTQEVLDDHNYKGEDRLVGGRTEKSGCTYRLAFVILCADQGHGWHLSAFLPDLRRTWQMCAEELCSITGKLIQE